MSGFLAPMNDNRARDVLKKLSHGQEAAAAREVLRQSYPTVCRHAEVKELWAGAAALFFSGADRGEPLVFVCRMDLPRPFPIGDTRGTFEAPLRHAHAVALLEALEALLGEGYRPSGDLYLVLTFDGLGQGAQSAAQFLRARAVKPCFVLDYGGYVAQGAFATFLPGGSRLALVGVTEKSCISGVMAAESYPRAPMKREPLRALLRDGARLARRTRQVRLCPTSREMLLAVGRRAPFLRGLPLRYPRLFFPLMRLMWRGRVVTKQFFASETELTGMLTRGKKAAAPAAAELSFRMTGLPQTCAQELEKRLTRRIHSPNVCLRLSSRLDGSKPSEAHGPAWEAIQTAVEILYERTALAPCVSPYETDARFFRPLSAKVYRFSPFLLSPAQSEGEACAANESTLQTAVQFFRQMLSV